MSHTLHYFGHLQEPGLLQELQEEYAEIAQVSGWSHERVDHVFAREDGMPGPKQSLRGIRLTVSPNAGQVQFTFDQDGYLAHLFYENEVSLPEAPQPVESGASSQGLRAFAFPRVDRPLPSRKVLHHVHTHTTLRDGNPETHRTVVKLLDYLSKKYVPNLEVIDNSGYWSTRDEKSLRGNAATVTP